MEIPEKLLRYTHPDPDYKYSEAPDGYDKTIIGKGEYEDSTIKSVSSALRLPSWIQISMLRSETNNDDVYYMVEALEFRWEGKDAIEVLLRALSEMTSNYVNASLEIKRQRSAQVAQNVEFELCFDRLDKNNPFERKPVMVQKKRGI